MVEPILPYSREQTTVLLVGALLAAGLSVFGTLYLIISSFVTKKWTFTWRLIVGLAIADLGTALTIGVGALIPLLGQEWHNLPRLCEFQAFCVELFALSDCMYTLMITVTLWMAVVKGKAEFSFYVELLIHVIPWFIGSSLGLLPLMPFVPLKYGPAGAWCWAVEKPVYGRFLLSYSWVWSTILIIFIIYTHLAVRTIQVDNSEAQASSFVYHVQGNGLGIRFKRWKKDMLSMKQRVRFLLWATPFCYAILWIAPTANRVTAAMGPPQYWLVLLETICIPLQGFLDALIWMGASRRYKNVTAVAVEVPRISRSSSSKYENATSMSYDEESPLRIQASEDY